SPICGGMGVSPLYVRIYGGWVSSQVTSELHRLRGCSQRRDATARGDRLVTWPGSIRLAGAALSAIRGMKRIGRGRGRGRWGPCLVLRVLACRAASGRRRLRVRGMAARGGLGGLGCTGIVGRGGGRLA